MGELLLTSAVRTDGEERSPLCRQEVDDVQVFAGHPESTDTDNLLIRTVYTCDDSGDTFVAHKHWHIVFSGGGFTNTGQIRFDGGTGEFTQLSGHGTINSESLDGNTGKALISGVLKLS